MELVPAPPADEVYVVESINGVNTSGGTRTILLSVGSGAGADYEGVGQLSAVAGSPWRFTQSTAQSPFPEIVLSSSTDYLGVEATAAITNNIAANYRVHSKVIA